MEVFGCYTPKKEHIDPLIHLVEMTLKKLIIDKIAKNTHRTSGLLS